MLILDENFQSELSGTHVGGPNSDIGPDPPTVPYAPLVLPNGALYSLIQSAPKAGAFPTTMAYFNRPVQPAATSLMLDFDLYVDGNIARANAIETDTMHVTAGAIPTTNVRRNFSVQNVKGQFYLVLTGQWVPIPGALLPLFTPGVRYHHAFTYAVGPDSGAILSISVNDQTFGVPASMQKADIALLDWTPFATMQLQQSLLPFGSASGLLLDNASYTWRR